MVIFVLLVSLLNIGLGAAVAIVLAREWPGLSPELAKFRWPDRKISPPEAHEAAALETPSTPEPESIPLNELPSNWQERIESLTIQPRTLLEAALHWVRSEGQAQRERWMTHDQSLRLLELPINEAKLANSLHAIQGEHANWTAWCEELLQTFELRREEFAAQPAEFEALHGVVLNLDSRLALFRESLTSEYDPEQKLRRIQSESAAVFESACALRDSVLESLATSLVAQERLSETSSEWQTDPVTQLPNRIGLEHLLSQWKQDDPTSKRFVSCALIEIDRLGKLNERLGMTKTDRVQRSFARLVKEVVRSERGDRTAQIGSAIFVLLADAGATGAKVAAERVRQSVESATFETRSEEFTLAANCAVCEIMVDDTVSELLVRLKAGLAEAKRGGRNRCAVDTGQGPVLFEPQPLHVPAQTIKVLE